MKIKLLQILLSVTFITCIPISGFCGNGLGSGDGLPTIDFQEEFPSTFPASLELDAYILRLARRFPTIAARFAELKLRFSERRPGYTLRHLLGSYEYELANSRYSDRVDSLGIPTTAQITYWNEFVSLADQPLRQRDILIHEFTHILITGSNETRTSEIAEELLRAETDSIENRQLPLLSARTRSIQVQGNPDILNRASDLYARALNIQDRCEEFNQTQTIVIQNMPLLMPLPPSHFRLHLQEDPFFLALRSICLRSSQHGQSFLDGFTSDPILHYLFLKSILGNSPHVIISEESDTALATIPRSQNVTALFRDLSLLSQRDHTLHIPSNELNRIIPGYDRWLESKAAFFLESEISTSWHYEASQAVRFFSDMIRDLGRTGTIIELTTYGIGLSIPPFGLFRSDSGTTAQCLVLASETLECRYRSRSGTTDRNWTLPLEWSTSVAGIDFISQWPGIFIEAPQNENH